MRRATAASPVVETFVNLSDKSGSDKGYHSVPPPLTGNFIPHKPDLIFIDEIVESKINIAGANVNIAGVSINTVNRPINTAASTPLVNHPRPKSNAFKRGYSQSSRPFNRYYANKNNINVNTARVKNTTARDRAVVSENKGKGANAVKASACWGNPQQKEYKEKAVIDSGCSRHMTGNKCYLDEYEDYDGGFVSFGDGKGRISRKGKIKTGSLDFDDVYFCKELKYNLFSVSQICDKKNNVLFTDTECLVLSSDFKLLDESQVLLRVPRKDNIYSVDLKSVVPTGGLTCLIAKATIDESNTWHRRLGHINFKTMNKLVKGNLVKGLPSKIFENDHSCVACQKGKQHKASYKTKLVNSISKPLHMLHMDLFGPTNVKSLMKKSYCLVVTDDFSRFFLIFFLATKDETSGILKTFITKIENQLDHKVKVIWSDNGTEFKNSIMNQFCERKEIKREFSVARTPQQNGVVERKNRILIEAARTMLVDSKLPTTFWAEALNIACYVLNRVLVIKPHNKTPYELIRGRPPLIYFMKPFRYLVTILNTKDPLGKFDGKADEGYFVRYSVVSKAMSVFNKRTRIVEETLNIRFIENTPNVKGNRPDWIFDVDSLSISMNYVPVATGNKTNGIAVTKDNIVAGPKDYEGDAGMKPTEVDENEASDKSGKHDQEARNNTGIFGNAYDDEDVEEEVDMNNVISSYSVPDTSFTKFHKNHPEDQVIRSLKTHVQTRHMTKINEEHGLISSVHKLRRTNHKDFQNLGKNKARTGCSGHTQEEKDIDYDEGLCDCYSPFDLEAFSNSDYAGASLDRKSTTGDCQFLSKRLISWQWYYGSPKIRRMIERRCPPTASRLRSREDSDAQTRFKTTSKQSNDPPLSKVNTYGSGKDSMQLIELMTPCTKLSAFVNADRHQLVLSIQVPAAEGDFITTSIQEKPAESEGFEQIVDFLNANPIRYALTINPTIYISCIQQFWDSVKLKTINGDIQIQALIDGKKIIVNKASIRRDLSTDELEAKVAHDDTEHEESIPTPYNDPLPSVLDLEKAKSDQAIEIASLKKRVNKLENRRKFRTTWLKRLKKVGASRRIESSDDSLGAQEDASKQRRRIEDIDADAEFGMVMRCLYVTTAEKEEQSTKTGEVVTTAGVEDCVAPTIPITVEDSDASIIPTTVEETLAHTLMEIKAAKPKAKGIIFHDQEEQVTMSTVSVTQPLIKDKGKGIMQEPKRSLKRKDQVALDEQITRDIQAQLDAKIIEEERAERLLAERLYKREEREEFDHDEGKRKMFMELMRKEKRKHFAPLRVQEKRNKPPTKAQKRTQMSTYLKHMGGYTYKQLKGKSFDEIQKLFDKEMKRVNSFVAMGSEVQESNEKKVEGSEEKAKSNRKKMLGKKRVVKEQQQESTKRQKLKDDKETDEHEEVGKQILT
ncbi:putative ribonuclease H-like domain-containing protein [Tanacetum coccineum]|uniref:Ribonuclease H-like domain-containing protein n=1 Tax=Tanacetum coccineum TaxID=301880 RepID=A0ABQ5I4J3_9ASTR